MSDEILCCVYGTQNVGGFDLRETKIHFYLFMRNDCVFYTVSVFPHRQVTGGSLQLSDTLAQGALHDNTKINYYNYYRSATKPNYHSTSPALIHEPHCYSTHAQETPSQCRATTAAYPCFDVFLSPFNESKGRGERRRNDEENMLQCCY